MLQAEKSQISASMVEKDNELSGKLMQIKQARQVWSLTQFYFGDL